MAVFSLLLLSFWTCAGVADPKIHNDYNASPTVHIKNGTIEGLHSSEYNQDFFLGIPYAQPPIYDLRFRVPHSINTSWPAPLSAKQYSHACIGYGTDQWPYPSISEDCLYLNVVRPAGYEHEKLPVAFWIHGGGLGQGSAIDQRYNMSFLVQKSVDIGKPIIGVSINYRLSMWGFITGAEVVASGNANLGLRDQRLALRWVQENIGAFGGDPQKVTIFGESAGALSVGMHLTAYNGRDDHLFRSAILQSGNPINYGTFAYNANDLLNASLQLGCSPTNPLIPILTCLRSLPTLTISNWINSTAGQSLTWNPIIDNDFITNLTSLQLASGAFVKVPIISGANSDEGTAFGPKPIPTDTQFYTTLTTVPRPNPLPLSPALASQVLLAYPPPSLTNTSNQGLVPTNLPASYIPAAQYGAASRRSDAYAGDVTMIASRRKTCQTWARNNIPAYCYRFNTVPHGIPAAVGATHFQEVSFVFNNVLGVGYGYPGVSEKPFEGMPGGYFELAGVMSRAWVNFINDGRPSGDAEDEGEEEEWWPKYEVSEGKPEGENRVFDANVTGLGYVERDDWRKVGIDLINSWDVAVYQR